MQAGDRAQNYQLAFTEPFLFDRNITCFFFFNDTATTEIYTLSLHDALPIFIADDDAGEHDDADVGLHAKGGSRQQQRSEEHTSELQSRGHLVCRLLLEK